MGLGKLIKKVTAKVFDKNVAPIQKVVAGNAGASNFIQGAIDVIKPDIVENAPKRLAKSVAMTAGAVATFGAAPAIGKLLKGGGAEKITEGVSSLTNTGTAGLKGLGSSIVTQAKSALDVNSLMSNELAKGLVSKATSSGGVLGNLISNIGLPSLLGGQNAPVTNAVMPAPETEVSQRIDKLKEAAINAAFGAPPKKEAMILGKPWYYIVVPGVVLLTIFYFLFKRKRK